MSCHTTTANYCKSGQRQQFMGIIVPGAGQGYLSPPVESATFVPLLSRNARQDCGDGRACSWWWITIHPKTVIRRSPGAAQDFAPLPQPQISNQGVSCSTLKVRLTLSDNTDDSRQIIVDVGAGISMAWYGPGVGIEVLNWDARQAPEREVVLVGPNFEGFNAETVEDTLIEANALAVDCCPDTGILPLLFTDVKQVGGTNQDLFFNRPAGAHKMAYYTTSGSPDIATFVAVPGAPYDASTEVARIIPSPAQANTRVGSAFSVPGAACAFVCVNSATGQYTCVWEIEP